MGLYSNLLTLEANAKPLLLIGSYGPSLITFRGPLICALVEAGYRVTAAAPGITTQVRERLSQSGVEVHETPMQRAGVGFLSDLRYAAALRRLMKEIRPDMVLTYTIKPNIWGAFAASSLRIPSVSMVTGLGFAFSDSGPASTTQRFVQKVARRLYRASTNRNRRVVFQNPDDRDDFVAAGCLADTSKVTMVNGSGVDLAIYEPAPSPSGPPVFLMIGRLLGDKGVREYAEAAKRIKRRFPDARFRVAGWIDENPDAIGAEELQEWIDEDTLKFLGKLDDVRPAISDSTVYVLPSYREGTPRSVLEAMAMGRPIITTDAPGCRETVIDGENGFLVPPRSVDALVEAMERFIRDPALAARMGRRSREIAEEKYDVHKVNAAILKALGLERTGTEEARSDD